MWSPIGKPRTVPATVRLAREWSNMEAARVDRHLSERRLTVYRKMLAEKAFRPVSWAKVHCKETNQEYRVNGQHTSALFSSVDESQLDGVYVVIEEYEADTLEDVARLYGTFDSPNQVRNAGDIYRQFAAVIPELAAIDHKFVGLAVHALALDKWKVFEGGGGVSAMERGELLFDNVDEVLWLYEMLGTQRRTVAHLWRGPVAAAMVGSYRRSKKAATDFWLAVRDETGLSPKMPDRVIAKYLLTHSVNRGLGAGRPARFRIKAKEFYVKCVHAWNAWRKDQTTDLKYFEDAKIPSFA